ncbi:unnamed protein product [Rhizophagus irregularis]|nr:unnamed protein product [Rhizophagus irregularis]
MGSKKLGPKFSEAPHPKAIYTSSSLSSYISECSSIYSSKGYISKELEFDIDIRSNEEKIEEMNINSNGNSGKSIKINSSCSKTSLIDRIKIIKKKITYN